MFDFRMQVLVISTSQTYQHECKSSIVRPEAARSCIDWSPFYVPDSDLTVMAIEFTSSYGTAFERLHSSGRESLMTYHGPYRRREKQALRRTRFLLDVLMPKDLSLDTEAAEEAAEEGLPKSG